MPRAGGYFYSVPNNDLLSLSYDGSHFASSLEISVEDEIKRGKPPRIHLAVYLRGSRSSGRPLGSVSSRECLDASANRESRIANRESRIANRESRPRIAGASRHSRLETEPSRPSARSLLYRLHGLPLLRSLRSKRFRKVFRTFEAFFVF